MDEYLKDGFVSSAEELLKQFNETEEVDCIYYNIYNVGNNVDDALSVRTAMLYAMQKEVEEYIWYKDAFELKVVLSSQTSPHLGGRCEVGVAVEDEWFIVYLLHKLSLMFPDVIISIVDRDGQFLLIEAADYLPDWLGPENSQHRIWIKRGALYIIPLEEYGRQRDGSLRLDAALTNMNSSNWMDYKATDTVQQAIQERINCYPAQIRAAKHTAPCILHSTIARLLLSSPELLSRSILAACEEPMDTKKKDTTIKILNGEEVVASKMVTVNVTMSKIQYAKLNFRRITKFPALQSLEPRFHSHSTIAYKCFDIGCRLTAGLEFLYRACNTNKLSGADSKQLEVCLTQCKQRLPHHLSAKPKNDIMSFCYVSDTGVDVNVTQFNEYFRLKHLGSLLSNLRCDVSSIDISSHTAQSLPATMNDEWMYMTPEDFEKYMNDLIHREEQSLSTTPAVAPAAEPTAFTSDLVKGVSVFMSAASDISGVCPDSLSEESIHKQLSFDMNKFLSILSGKNYQETNAEVAQESDDRDDFYASDYDDSDDNSEEDNEELMQKATDIRAIPIAATGVKSFLVSEEEASVVSSGSADSDDFDVEEDFNFSRYMESMAAELDGSTLRETYEYDDNNEIDVETSLLKHLLESHASQDGGVGPASQLLAQLGIKLPSMPNVDDVS